MCTGPTRSSGRAVAASTEAALSTSTLIEVPETHPNTALAQPVPGVAEPLRF